MTSCQWMHGEEIAFTAQLKINSHSQIFRYGQSIHCLSVVRVQTWMGEMKFVCLVISCKQIKILSWISRKNIGA